MGLLLPAVQSAREAARRTQCANNIRQMALGALNYESAMARYPTSGEGKTATFADAMNIQSFFTQVLPYLEESAVADQWNKEEPYWSPNNDALATAKVSAFLCPSNGLHQESSGGLASNGAFYGQTHYMPVAYTDIDPVNGTRNKRGAYKRGLLSYDQSTGVGAARDGTSKTVIFFEDAGREQEHVGKAPRQLGGNVDWVMTRGGRAISMTPTTPGWVNGSGNTCPNRWADSDNASGLSGSPHTEQMLGGRKILKNVPESPIGGSPATCLWTSNNCGPNDEPYSLHPGVVLAGFADGSVHILSEDLDTQTCRRLADPMDGQPVSFE